MKNTDTVARLTKEGKMRPAGIAAVEAAKGDGRWDRAYAGPATITVPDDLAAALAAESTASAFFNGLKSSDRYAVLHRVHTAPLTTRAKRVEALVQMLATGNVPGRIAKHEKSGKERPSAKKTGTNNTIVSARKVASEGADTSQTSIAKVKQKRQPRSATDANGPRRPGLRPRG